MKLLIGIAGDGPGVGKSTVRNLIISEYYPDLVRVAFADALKQDVLHMLANYTGLIFDRDELERKKGDIYGPLCQGFGEYMRTYVRPDYWIDQWADRIRLERLDQVIADDVRHPNEAHEIRRLGGWLLYVSGPPQTDDQRDKQHASERNNGELKLMADYVIQNTGTVTDLAAEVALAMESLTLTRRFDPDYQRVAS